MTAAPAGPPVFSFLSQPERLNRTRSEAFLVSLAGQAVIVALLTYFTCCVVGYPPGIKVKPPDLGALTVIFSGHSGGGGGHFDKLPPTHGNFPRASLAEQIAPPDVVVPREMPRLPAEETIVAAPDLNLPQGGQIGDPMSSFSRMLSNGPGGPGGIGYGCCDGVGDSIGPHAGSGPPGIFPAGKKGVTVPQVIYSPEPSFSDEARKAKQQGAVVLLLVVGKDGRAYDIRVRQSLGMGLDEEAVNAVTRWRFRPATLNGQPVATEIEVQVDFHLY